MSDITEDTPVSENSAANAVTTTMQPTTITTSNTTGGGFTGGFTADAPLGESGQRALESERAARKAAERELAAAAKRADDLEAKAAGVMERLQSANLRSALAEMGITGPKAAAAMKLIDGIEFNADGQPTNLQGRITAAKAEYGEEVFQGATPDSPPEQQDEQEQQEEVEMPDLHAGVRRDADTGEDEAFEQYMNENFPPSAFESVGG